MPPGLHNILVTSRHPLSAQPPEDGQLADRRIVNPVLFGGLWVRIPPSGYFHYPRAVGRSLMQFLH